jgi:hypothetical protein
MALGTVFVMGKKRVAQPPTGNTAFVTIIELPSVVFHLQKDLFWEESILQKGPFSEKRNIKTLLHDVTR